jgi:xanthine dehydrogenase accessory factor
VIASGPAKMLEFGVADETAWRVGLSCGGKIRVYRRAGRLMDPHLLRKLNAARRDRKAAIMLTDLADGRNRLIMKDDPVTGDWAAVERHSGPASPARWKSDGQRFFLNVHVPSPRMVIIGAVHISQVLAPMATMAGFDVRVIDPRTAFATPERFENVDLVADWPEDALKDRPIDPFTALVAVTHDPKIDDWPLIAALKTERVLCWCARLAQDPCTAGGAVERGGSCESEIGRIDAPIGLDIGAQSPEEIAVAILGQVIAGRKPAPHTPGKRESLSHEVRPGRAVGSRGSRAGAFAPARSGAVEEGPCADRRIWNRSGRRQ